jgi:hypothetical protein
MNATARPDFENPSRFLECLFALLRPQSEDNQHAESLITRAYADADAIIRGTKRVDWYDLIMALVLYYPGGLNPRKRWTRAVDRLGLVGIGYAGTRMSGFSGSPPSPVEPEHAVEGKLSTEFMGPTPGEDLDHGGETGVVDALARLSLQLASVQKLQPGQFDCQVIE